MMFGSPHIAQFMGLPLWLKDVDRFQASAEYPSKMWKVRGVDAPASAMREVQGESVYAYRFDWDEEPKVMFLDLSKALGAGHGIEIPFVFGWLSLGPGTRFVFADDKMESNRRLSRSMMSYWAEFAYSGNPGRGRKSDQPLWKSWSDATQTTDKFIIFDSEAGGGVRMSSDDTLTREAVIAQVAGDERLLEHQRDRCEIYLMLSRWSREMTSADYAAVEAGSCAEKFPFEAYPWKS
jgi:para-nitrobenzyl esterase